MTDFVCLTPHTHAFCPPNTIYFLNRKYLEEQSRMSAYDFGYQNMNQSYNYGGLGAATVTKAATPTPRKKVFYNTGLYDYLQVSEKELEILAESLIRAHVAFEDDKKKTALAASQVAAIKATQAEQDRQIKLQQERAKAEAEKEAKRQAELKRVPQPGERVSYVDAKGAKKFGVVAAPSNYNPGYLSGLTIVWAYWGNSNYPTYMERNQVTVEKVS